MTISRPGSGAAAKGTASITVAPYASTNAGDLLICESACWSGTITFPDGAPVFRAAGAKSAGTTGAVTVSAPVGVSIGDLEILISSTISGQTVSITSNGGSSWTSIGSATCTSGEDIFGWYRIRQSGDTNPQVTPSGDHSCSVRLCYFGGTFDTTTPIDNFTTSNENTSDTSFSWAPGYSSSEDLCRILVASTSGQDTNTAQVPVCTNANLTDLNSRANFETSNGLGGGFGITDGTLATAGSVGTFACTYANASAKAYFSFAIRPVSGATPWTVIIDDTNGSIRQTVGYKIAVASEPSFKLTYSGSSAMIGRCHTFATDASWASTPVQKGTSHHDTGTGNGGTLTATGMTPTSNGSAVGFCGSEGVGNTDGGAANYYASWSGTNPTFTEIGDDVQATGTAEASIGFAWGTSDGTATGDRTVALSSLSTGTWVAIGTLISIDEAVSSNVTLNPTIGNLALASDTNALRESFSPTIGNLVLASDTISPKISVVPSIGNLVLSSNNQAWSISLTEPIGILLLGADTASVSTSNNITVNPTIGVLSLTGNTNVEQLSVAPTIGNIALQGNTQVIKETVSVPIGTLMLSGDTSSLGETISPSIGVIVLGSDGHNISNRSVSPTIGTLILTSDPPTVSGGTGPQIETSVRQILFYLTR